MNTMHVVQADTCKFDAYVHNIQLLLPSPYFSHTLFSICLPLFLPPPPHPTSLSPSLPPFLFPPSPSLPSIPVSVFPFPLPLPPAQLLKEAQGYAQVTPLQVSYLFDLCSMEEKAAGSVSLTDFRRLLPRPTPFSQHQATHQTPTSSEVCSMHVHV